MPTLLLSLILCGPDVHALAANDFATRERAEQRLKRRPILARQLCQLPFVDPERARRARRVMARWEHSFRPPGGVWPAIGWLIPDMAASWADDDGENPRIAFMYGSRVVVGSIPFRYMREFDGIDPPLSCINCQRHATRRMITDMRRANIPDCVCYLLLRIMADREHVSLRTLRPGG